MGKKKISPAASDRLRGSVSQIPDQAKQEGCVQPAAVGHFEPSAEQKAQKTRGDKDGHPAGLAVSSPAFVLSILNGVQGPESNAANRPLFLNSVGKFQSWKA